MSTRSGGLPILPALQDGHADLSAFVFRAHDAQRVSAGSRETAPEPRCCRRAACPHVNHAALESKDSTPTSNLMMTPCEGTATGDLVARHRGFAPSMLLTSALDPMRSSLRRPLASLRCLQEQYHLPQYFALAALENALTPNLTMTPALTHPRQVFSATKYRLYLDSLNARMAVRKKEATAASALRPNSTSYSSTHQLICASRARGGAWYRNSNGSAVIQKCRW
ncbi:hypothetical protein EWM64_g3538 [Hericium alpestre]|uniref:Uncharacterized protein n=1 Tax=Hericium alpestre TaxID=135208 RepID=A0A4Z0A1B0_9AGAM|nr:hypothetical protein EWM64_g3538 [Hericium alpestre]